MADAQEPRASGQQSKGQQSSSQAEVDKIAEALFMRLKGCFPGPMPPFPPGPPWPMPPWPPVGPWPPGPPWPPMPPWPPGPPIGPGFLPPVLMAWLLSWLFYPGLPYGGGPGMTEAAWRFAATRDDFWRHMADASGDVFQQAANASRFTGQTFDPRWPPPWCEPCVLPIDLAKLRKQLESWPEEERNRVVWAAQCANMAEQSRSKGA